MDMACTSTSLPKPSLKANPRSYKAPGNNWLGRRHQGVKEWPWLIRGPGHCSARALAPSLLQRWLTFLDSPGVYPQPDFPWWAAIHELDNGPMRHGPRYSRRGSPSMADRQWPEAARGTPPAQAGQAPSEELARATRGPRKVCRMLTWNDFMEGVYRDLVDGAAKLTGRNRSEPPRSASTASSRRGIIL